MCGGTGLCLCTCASLCVRMSVCGGDGGQDCVFVNVLVCVRVYVCIYIYKKESEETKRGVCFGRACMRLDAR